VAQLILAMPANDPLQLWVIHVRQGVGEDGRLAARLAVGRLREDVGAALGRREELLHVAKVEAFEDRHVSMMTK
jgi:hypothetical protein